MHFIISIFLTHYTSVALKFILLMKWYISMVGFKFLRLKSIVGQWVYLRIDWLKNNCFVLNIAYFKSI